MAFCPQCGKPNTQQATTCVSCGKALERPKKKEGASKFKGTMMMGAVPPRGASSRPPAAQQPRERSDRPPAPSPQPPRPVTPSPAPAASGGRYKKTILGPGAAQPPASGSQHADAPPATMPSSTQPRQGAVERDEPHSSEDALGHHQPPSAGHAVGRGNTLPRADAPPPAGEPPDEGGGARSHGTDPAAAAPDADLGYQPTQQALPNTSWGVDAPAQPRLDTGDPHAAGYTGPSSPDATANPASDLGGPAAFPGEDGIPGARNNNRALLYVGAGCLAALVLVAVVTAVVFAGPVLAVLGFADEAATAAEGVVMRGTAVMTLQRVHAACSSGSCDAAADAFHPEVRERLLPKASALNEAALDRLSDISQSSAEALDETEDAHVAEALGIEPEQCSRLHGGELKVITCRSEDGATRIIHMAGLSTP